MEGKVFSFHDVPASTKKELTELIKDYGGEVLYVGKNVSWGIQHQLRKKLFL